MSAKPNQFALPALGLILLSLLVWVMVGTGRAPENPAAWRPAWRTLMPLHHARRALAAATDGNFIYVVGGIDDQNEYVREVEYAPMLPDGTVGPWRVASSLNEGRFYLAAAVVNGYLYAIGGANGARGADNMPSATVERARVAADGSLGPWERHTYLTTPRRGLKAVSDGQHLYALGGYNGAFLKTIERTDVAAEGQLAGWREEPAQAVIDRYIHAAARYGSYIYLLGGHVQGADTMSYGDVEAAHIGADGSLSAWQVQASRLNTARFIAEACAVNGYLYILGGHDGAQRLDSVEFARIARDGSVASWHYTAPLHEGRSALAVAVHGNSIYVLGGAGTAGALNSVEMARQAPDGGLGQPEN